MKRILCMIMAVLLAGCGKAEPEMTTEVSGAEEETVLTELPPAEKEDETVQEYLSGMSVREKLTQMMMPAFRQWNGENVTRLNDELKEILSTYAFGGVILFGENLTADPVQTVELIRDIQASNRIGMLIGTDQEGGIVYRLSAGTSMPGNMAIAATGDPDSAYTAAKIMGSELSALGFNTDFAPVLDINSNPRNPVIGVRSFSDDPATVSRFGTAFAQGLQSQNIIACLKHFPGHGDTDSDSHTGLPKIDKTRDELRQFEWLPFESVIRNGAEMIMTAHTQYPAVEPYGYLSIADGEFVNLPATLSPAILTECLRNELGFEGVIVTDSLLMDAIAVHFDPADAADLAINAGADLLLMPVSFQSQEDVQWFEQYLQELEARVESGVIPAENVDASAERILRLKYRHGLLNGEEQDPDAVVRRTASVGSKAHHDTEMEIAQKAVTVLKNELNTDLNKAESIALITPNGSLALAAEYAFRTMKEEGIVKEDTEIRVINQNWGLAFDDALAAIEGSDLAIIVSAVFSQDDLAESDSLAANAQTLIHTAQGRGIPVIAVSANLPYDAPLLCEAETVLCIYNYYGILFPDENGNPAGTYGPNLIAALRVLFTGAEAKGKLPVDLPAVENGMFTDTIAFSRN